LRTDDTHVEPRDASAIDHLVDDSALPTDVATRIVLDTSVLVADPACIHSFPGCDVVIPLTVIEELDSLKTRMDDVGRSARTALRTIEDLRRKAGGSLATPAPVNDDPNGGTLQIEINGIQRHLLVEHGLDPEVPDNRIIGAALGQARTSPTRMISNDAALRIKAAHMGLTADEHQPVGTSMTTRPMGWTTIVADHSPHSPAASDRSSPCSPTMRQRPGACVPAARNNALPSSCCSTRRSR
jgi:PhoH-like ATPase